MIWQSSNLKLQMNDNAWKNFKLENKLNCDYQTKKKHEYKFT